MANDRGTMQRGLHSGPQEQGLWPEPTAPSGRRLPSAPRERKPALAALALLLIAGGALAAGFLVIRSGKRVAAIEIFRQVGAGQQLPLSAMEQVQVASDSGVPYVPWGDASQVARYYAATTIPPGTLLTSSMVARASAVTNGKDVIGLALKDGQWPGQLAVGDHVAVFSVASSGSTASGCPGSGGSLLTGDASVLNIATSGSGGSLVGSGQSGSADVTVAVSPAAAGSVACNAAAGDVAVAVLPAGGQQPAAVPAPATTAPGGTARPKRTPSGAAATSPAARRSPSSSSSPPTGHG